MMVVLKWMMGPGEHDNVGESTLNGVMVTPTQSNYQLTLARAVHFDRLQRPRLCPRNRPSSQLVPAYPHTSDLVV